jgi:hypothetical protein
MRRIFPAFEMRILGTGHSNYFNINKLNVFLGPKRPLEAAFWGQKAVFKDSFYKLTSLIFLKRCFATQNGAFKPILRGIIVLKLFIINLILRPDPVLLYIRLTRTRIDKRYQTKFILVLKRMA